MSKEAVEQMLQAAGSDLALQQKLQAVNGFEEAVQIGSENGYSFSVEEARTVLTERGLFSEEGPEGELSDEALEAVAGGWFDNWRVRFGSW